MVSSSGQGKKRGGIKSLFNNAAGRRSVTAFPPDPPPKQQLDHVHLLHHQQQEPAMNPNSVTERLLPKASASRPQQQQLDKEFYLDDTPSSDYRARTSSIADSSPSNSSVSLGMQHQQQQQQQQQQGTRRLPKSAVRENQVGHLLNQVEQLKQQREQQCRELELRYQKLQEMLTAKEQEYSRISSSFHRHVMSIRATDDDYSTVQARLTMLQSKISAVPFSLKKYAVPRQDATKFFSELWPHLVPAFKHLSKLGDALDYGTVSLLVEKLISQKIIELVYNAPIHVGLPVNDAFEQIKAYMDAQGQYEWSTRLRQQLTKLTAMSVRSSNNRQQQQSQESRDQVQVSIIDGKSKVICEIVNVLLKIYSDEGRQTIESKITKLVDTAAEISLAIHSQDTVIYPMPLVEGHDHVDLDKMILQNGSDETATVIQIVICPPFVTSEADNNLLVLSEGKVICF